MFTFISLSRINAQTHLETRVKTLQFFHDCTVYSPFLFSFHYSPRKYISLFLPTFSCQLTTFPLCWDWMGKKGKWMDRPVGNLFSQVRKRKWRYSLLWIVKIVILFIPDKNMLRSYIYPTRFSTITTLPFVILLLVCWYEKDKRGEEGK